MQEKLPTPKEQRNMILAMFFSEDDDDGTCFLALVDHCGIDLTACHGDVKQIPSVIAAHYRLARGRYDIDRAAHDLFSLTRRLPPALLNSRRKRRRMPNVSHTIWVFG